MKTRVLTQAYHTNDMSRTAQPLWQLRPSTNHVSRPEAASDR